MIKIFFCGPLNVISQSIRKYHWSDYREKVWMNYSNFPLFFLINGVIVREMLRNLTNLAMKINTRELQSSKLNTKLAFTIPHSPQKPNYNLDEPFELKFHHILLLNSDKISALIGNSISIWKTILSFLLNWLVKILMK